ADPEADPADPHEPVDHLGLRRLHAAVPADRPVEADVRQLPDGRVPLRGGLPEDRLRTRRRDFDRDARDRRRAERGLRPQDGDAGRRAMRASQQRRAVWNIVGLAGFAIMDFSVDWMVSIASRGVTEGVSTNTTWVPVH